MDEDDAVRVALLEVSGCDRESNVQAREPEQQRGGPEPGREPARHRVKA